MKPFIQFDYDDAAELLGPRIDTSPRTFPLPVNERRPPTALSATEFYNGNHWQLSHGFIGQLPPASLPGSQSILADIKAGFVSENVIQEVVETHTGGLLGREPVWSFLPKDAKDTTDRDTETGHTLTPWWNRRKALRDLQKATITLLNEGVAVRRLFFPRGRIKGTTLSAPNIAAALDFIYFETTTADTAGVFTDPDTQRDIGVWLFEERDVNGDVLNQAAELSFLDDAGRTVCKVVRDQKKSPSVYGPYDLGGHLLIYELNRRALITEQVQSNQRALNLAHTMMMRNVNLAGSRERTVTNAQPPIPTSTKPSITSDTVKTAGRFPGTYKTGAGAVNYVNGWPIYAEDGKTITGYTNPNVSVYDPVSVETFVATSDHYREAIYSQCHQRHVLIVDKADTSGRAREVARREFERSLKETKAVLDASGRWQLESTLYLAANITGQTSKYLQLRSDFNTLLDAGEPDPEKQKTTLLLRQPGGPAGRPLISEETAMAWIGVEDAAAETQRIDHEAQIHPPLPQAPAVSGQQVPKPQPMPAPEVIN